MTLRVCCALAAVAALPFFLEATTGCSYTSPIDEVDLNFYDCACDCQPGQRHRDPRVGFIEDDAEQQLPAQNNNILLNSPDLDFLNGRFVGLRFRDVRVPPGSAIIGAWVQFIEATGSTAGPLTVRIKGQAADNAGPFSTAPGSLGILFNTASTTAFADWNPPDWGAGGNDQLSPDLSAIVQEIVDRAGWVEGNSLVLLFSGTAGAALRKAFSRDGQPDAAAVLMISYVEALPDFVQIKSLHVCVPAEFNEQHGGVEPTNDQLIADCNDRVQTTLSNLLASCFYPPVCNCSAVTNSTGAVIRDWSDTCDANAGVCMPNTPDCAHIHEATNFPGDQPVCTANSPLGAHLFGRRTTCEVEGTAHVTVDDDTESSDATGIVEFVGDLCPGQSCAIGMEYRLDIDPVTFGNFFGSATFSNLGGVGETVTDAMLSPAGDGSFAPDAAMASGQGQRGSDLRGLATTNFDPVDVNVSWGNVMPTCSLEGTVLGSVDPEASRCENAGPDAGKICQDDSGCADDPACSDEVCNCEPIGDAGVQLSLEVAGDIVNQPPTADAGPDQTIECTNAAVTNVVLDASGSTDLDGNIVFYSWLQGDLNGPEVGFDMISKVEQPLGTQTYVARVFDKLAQMGLDTTEVSVVDTTPPVLSCAVATSVLNQTNHNLFDVGLTGDAVDQCEGELPVTVNVFADEDDEENTGDGRHSPDAKDLAVGSLRLRGERKGSSDGRVYLIIVEATDSSGNRGSSCCTVTVPLSNTQAALTSVQAQAATAQAFCLANDGTAPAGYFVVGDGPVLGPKQ